MDAETDTLGILLAMDDGRAGIDDPLDAKATREGQRPRENDPKHYYRPGGDPNDLAAQGWSLIVPEGAVGDRLVEIARPLIEKRADDQGLSREEVKVFRVSSDPRLRTPEGATEWSHTHYDDRKRSSEDVPLYQLILGDLDQVPLAIQQRQSLAGRVGRLHFDDERGYEAYIDKLLRWERATPQRTPGRVVFHTAHDGSGALKAGHAGLIAPLLELMNAEQERGRSVAGAIEVGGGVPLDMDIDGFFERTGTRDAGVLFTMSHGLGGPRDGWKREEDRRARQGAMMFGLEGSVTGAELAERTFMPGGVWFMFACYSAGTPDVSAYQHWLARLASLGKIKHTDVLASLKGAKPFIASLPQRVLANPDGPLAFVGHVDLAWSYSFQDGDDATKRRPGQFQRIVEPMLRADRMGVAVSELSRAQADAETGLAGYYDEDARTSSKTGDEARRAFLWMQRNDLAGYVLLGDPAARLPVSPPAKKSAKGAASMLFASAVSAQPTAVTAPAMSAQPATIVTPSVTLPANVDPSKLERAICDQVGGMSTTKKLAASCGLDPETFEKLAKIYRDAGRAALGIKS